MDGPDASTYAATGAAVVGDILKHHGVVGMKWGHRKGSSGSSSKSSTPTHASADHIQVEKHQEIVRQHGIKALSNEHLQQVNNRLNLEKQYKDLTKNKNSSKFDTGHKHVKKVLAIAKTANDIHNTVNGPVGKIVKTAIKAKKSSE